MRRSGTSVRAVLAAACLALGACGGGDEPADRAAPPPTTGATTAETTAAEPPPARTGTTGAKSGGRPDPRGGPEHEARVRRYAQRAARGCARVRENAGRAPRPPADARGFPRFARRLLPVAQRTLARLERERPAPADAPAVDQLIQAYTGLLPLLQQLAVVPPGAAGSGEAQRAAQLLPGAISRVQGQALAAGLPGCGLPAA